MLGKAATISRAVLLETGGAFLVAFFGLSTRTAEGAAQEQECWASFAKGWLDCASVPCPRKAEKATGEKAREVDGRCLLEVEVEFIVRVEGDEGRMRRSDGAGA